MITKYLEDSKPVVDWTSDSFGRTWALFILFEFATMATQSTLYWIVSFRAYPPPPVPAHGALIPAVYPRFPQSRPT